MVLPPQLDMDAAAALQGSLADKLSLTPSALLDASAIERPSTSYIQILLTCLRVEKPASIINASPALHAAWADFGLTSSFPLEQ